MKDKLVSAGQVAEMLGVSLRGIWRMRDGGRLPVPVTLGRLVRWRESDISAWIGAGCPDVRRTGWVPSAESKGGVR